MRTKVLFALIGVVLCLTPTFAQVWNSPVTAFSSPYAGGLAIIDGRPALACTGAFIRADDATGSSWSAPVSLPNNRYDNTLIKVNGNPAILYYTGRLEYVRATNAAGTSWGSSVLLPEGYYSSIGIVNGNPAVSYMDMNTGELAYIRATDPNGSTWGSPVIIADAGFNVGQAPSMTVVNGKPAIAYQDGTNNMLTYVRAADSNGSSWDTPVIAHNLNGSGQYTSLKMIGGKPAIAYSDGANGDLYYIRATDLSGNSWGTPVNIDAAGATGQYCSMTAVAGKPAIAYYNTSNQDLKYVRALDATGDTWESPATLVSTGNVGLSSDLAVNGDDVFVAYYNTTTSAVYVIHGVAGNTWTGAASSTDWYTTGNWSRNAVPGTSDEVIIPPGTFYPVVSSNTAQCAALSIETGAMLTINGTGNLHVKNMLDNNGSIEGTRALILSGTTSQSLSGTGNISYLELNNSAGAVITNDALVNLTGIYTPTSGVLTTNGRLTLKSTATATAGIATGSGTYISGNVIVERYIPAVTRRSRMISPGISSFTFNDLKDDIFVTGPGGITNGFDASNPNNSTVYTYRDSTTGGRGWKGISNISNSLAPGTGALVFIRGDRNLPSPAWYTQDLATYPATNGFPSQDAFVMDFTGTVNQGDISPALSYTNTGSTEDDGWNLVGNPYPSSIDWNSISKNNLAAFYYVYDPASGSYIADDGENAIASGQGFFVQATASSPSLTFTESCKTVSAPVSYFKAGTPTLKVKMIRDSLNSDLLKITFGNGSTKNYHPSEDARKLQNADINLAVLTNNDSILLQYSKNPALTSVADTFRLYAMAPQGSYTLRFSDLASINNNYDVYLNDALTGTSQNLRVDNNYTFQITGSPASKGKERFSLVFVNTPLLPVTLTLFEGKRVNENDAELKWQTAGEKNSSHFILQRSNDQANWIDVHTIKATGHSGTASYHVIDNNALADGSVYYRLKQHDKSSHYTLSHAIIIQALAATIQPALYPNPASSFLRVDGIEENTLLKIYDVTGKEVLIRSNVKAGEQIRIEDLESGSYIVMIINSDTNKPLLTSKMIKTK